jgi:hypothetical protein
MVSIRRKFVCGRTTVSNPQDETFIAPWPSKPLFNHGERSRVDVMLPVWVVGIGFGSETDNVHKIRVDSDNKR